MATAQYIRRELNQMCEIDNESATAEQNGLFLNMAVDFSFDYVMDRESASVHDALETLFFGRPINYGEGRFYRQIEELFAAKKGNSHPFEAREELIKAIDSVIPSRHCVNCLASSVYMSREAQKLGILTNILLYEDKGNYHAALLYKCNGELLVCDLTYYSPKPDCVDNRFISCPYLEYTKSLNKYTGGCTDLSAQNAWIIDMNITPKSGPIIAMRLSDWNPQENGIYTREKAGKLEEREANSQQFEEGARKNTFQ